MGWQLPPELQTDPRQHVRSDSLAPGKGKVVRQLPITNNYFYSDQGFAVH